MIAYLGLGSNRGDRAVNLATAAGKLAETELRIVARSPVYETLPVGVEAQERYFNAVVAVETAITPQELLDRCSGIEQAMGRIRSERWGPRVIDIDILLCDGIVLDEERLNVPHPRMHERAFVLRPLADIASDMVHPLLDLSIAELLARTGETGIIGVAGSL